MATPTLHSDSRAAQLMTAPEVARLLVMPESVQEYARRGILPPIKIGRHRRFRRDDVMTAIESRRRQGTRSPVA